MWELTGYFAACSEAEVASNLNKLAQVVQEVVKLQSMLIDQANKAVCKGLADYLRKDFKPLKDTRSYFNRISNDLDSALNRNAAVSRGKPAEVEEASNLLTATHTGFSHTSLDYVFRVTMLQSSKRHEVTEALLAMISAYSDFFRKGGDLFREVNPFAAKLTQEVDEMRKQTSKLEKIMEKRHDLVSKANVNQGPSVGLANSTGSTNLVVGGGVATAGSSSATGSAPINLEGYLFKRGQNAFRTWNRRWFYLKVIIIHSSFINVHDFGAVNGKMRRWTGLVYHGNCFLHIFQNNQLCYSKRSGEDVTIMEEDLRVCLVRPLTDIDRRFCFEVISPTKSHVLQADSDELFRKWLTTLQQGISSAIHETIITKDGVGLGGRSGIIGDDQGALMEGHGTGTGGGLRWEDSDSEDNATLGGVQASGSTSGTASAALRIPSVQGDPSSTSPCVGSIRHKLRRSAQQILLIPGEE